MKLIARLFALSLVATGAFASTQLHQSSKDVVTSASMSIPVACCPPDGSTDCGIGQ